MLKKICKCGAKIEINQRRCSICEQKRKAATRYYDKYQRKNKEIYHSTEWTTLTEMCKNKFNKLDIFAFYEYNIIKQGALSHHIIEVEEDRSRAFDLDNLIYVSEKSHAIIHSAYEKDDESRQSMQTKLFQYIQRWTRG